MHDQGLLRTLGVRIRRIADLEEGAIYLADRNLLLLDIELSDRQMQKACETLLAVVPVPIEASTRRL